MHRLQLFWGVHMTYKWEAKAKKNIEKWGAQDMETLLLATMEELGELTQAWLQFKHQDTKFNRVVSELDDVMALGYQMLWVLENPDNSDVTTGVD